MSKRKPATASKRARGPRIVAKAQRTAQAVVRSPKVGIPPVSSDSQQDALPVENPLLVAEAALQDDSKQITENNSKTGVDILSSATANVRAYQAKLLEIAQANMQFAFEFAQRLAMTKTPLEFPGVIAEFTSKRIAMFRNHSREMAELSTKRWTS
ncbi:phasin family protein [Bradyrhizobium sp. 2TAF36]|uniref:Phasin family protein n=1 Tax=Bradyrhizobium barranii subsp. barranii TaxID=2823807 RepID=A0A7Z0TU92_9BRAD|nr:phasin family protein [Bradyrhizobium barranii]UGX91713.1 phasin family protein [Bradyrhizobium barranii subsp. barranii]